MANVLDELKARGLVYQTTDEASLREALASPIVAYGGFDPTASSLHAGNLLPLFILAHLQRAGHRPICLVGGATGLIGDPSGKDEERELLPDEVVAANAAAIRAQCERFLSFEGAGAARLVDNLEWTRPLRFLDFLRDVGKHFTVNHMLAKESVHRRLGGEGISYAEFSYMLVQAHDYLHLHEAYGCTLQIGGSDQWGNITAGIELLRRVRGTHVHGLTNELLTTATGEKFGKTAAGAIWLDPARTSPYAFYQYWINTDDRDVEGFLRRFTFLPLDEIGEIAAAHRVRPERREAQRRLAGEVTRIVHGEAELARAERASRVLFGGDVVGLSDGELLAIFADVPSARLPRARLAAGIPLVELLAESSLCQSKAEARRLVASGGAYLNNRRLEDPEQVVTESELASESLLVLRRGKKSYHLVRFA